MGALLSFDRARSEIRAEEREAAKTATAALDLRTNLLLALSTGKGRVPIVRRERIESEHVAETVSDVLAYDDVAALLMQVLAHCPDAGELQQRVEALRERIVERVVHDRADLIAQYDVE